jgi:hypothetical protein
VGEKIAASTVEYNNGGLHAAKPFENFTTAKTSTIARDPSCK